MAVIDFVLCRSELKHLLLEVDGTRTLVLHSCSEWLRMQCFESYD